MPTKTIQVKILVIIIAAAAIAVIIFLVINYFELETKPHTTMKLIGLGDNYNVYQIIRFQVYAEGYGYSCVGTPEIVIFFGVLSKSKCLLSCNNGTRR